MQRALGELMNFVNVPLATPFAAATTASQYGTQILKPVERKTHEQPKVMAPANNAAPLLGTSKQVFTYRFNLLKESASGP
jgi:hypothetical protein